MRQTLRQHAALIRPVARNLFAFALLFSLLPLAARAEASTAVRREQAKEQFDRAEKNRQALEGRPESARTLQEYTALVTAYQRVYLITAHAAEVPAAIHQVAELFRTMGDLFDVKYYPRSVESYRYLIKEYPASKYRDDSLLAVAHIEQDDLHEPALAQKDYEEFLKQRPHSTHAAEVRALLNKLAAEETAAKTQSASPGKSFKDNSEPPAAKTVSADRAQPSTDTKQGAAEENAGADASGPLVSRIRTWNAYTYTRVVIDIGAKVKYQAARISGPDRIYFDIEGAKLSAALLRKPIDLDGSSALKSIRFAQNQAGVVRVVLEVNHVSDYSVFLLSDPYRLVVDVYANSAAAEAAARSTTPPPGPTTTDAAPLKPEKTAVEEAAKPPAKSPAKSATKSVAEDTKPSAPDRPEGKQDKSDADASTTPVAAADASPRKRSSNPAKTPETGSARGSKTPADSNSAANTEAENAAPNADDSQPPLRTATVKKSGKSSKSAHDQAAEMGPPPMPELTRDGQHSLTRALGLKVGRIVIDPGHGGHDTGTIGPTGLMEKDLCLDIALRLGKLIQQRLPNAEVIFTRDDDTFIPLERRTEIANEAKADLFVSIHANSSPDRAARGIETYYLNFTGSSDAMEVAARENALSENSVHDLQDIVKKIARSEKIEESRDLATIIQDSLARRMDSFNRAERNRGVRKAPFVVLIGADMPSVLAEISFISNPSDEQWLKKPENRQRVADGLYRGIESYLHSTNSLALNQMRAASESRTGAVARTGNSR